MMSKDPGSMCPLGTEDCPISSEIERLNAELQSLRQQVIRDSLTGLFNKRHFTKALSTEMERSRRSQSPTSLILLDIDHFKSINDRYGHVAGDHVLEQFARTLEETVRMIDIPCRYGGEEFAIILLATPLPIAYHVAERLRAEIASTPIRAGNQSISITASLGVSGYDYGQASSPADLTRRADRQLYLAKQQGRNCVRSESPGRSSARLSEGEKAALFDHDDAAH